eukprot:CAMPEP_0118984508 /NCGR_PEP_ID=MMETSP1173-20130426/37915_1 /TAXON_ID=1034831 /ORGANISM="Rhizochromulina marina cf, Strain CCMP1243" /LENGTH=150 /DNA_ID=CAMNT_0006935173 /DNA_START=51 /DNA_END=500 /DNA_ORIENTATION=+
MAAAQSRAGAANSMQESDNVPPASNGAGAIPFQTLVPHLAEVLRSSCVDGAARDDEAIGPSAVDVVQGALRVLINLTHHNPVAVAAMTAAQGLSAVVRCLSRSLPGLRVVAGAEDDGGSGPRPNSANAAATGPEDDKAFDLALLSLNALT